MKLSSTLLVLGSAALAHHDLPHHEHEYREEIVEEWITNMKVIGGLIHKKPEVFRELMGVIDPEYVQMKWDFCNTDGDDIITAAEEAGCMKTVTDSWELEHEWEEFQEYIASDAETQHAIAKSNPDGNYDFHEFTAYCTFDIMTRVYGQYMTSDANNNHFLEKDELAAANKVMKKSIALLNFDGLDVYIKEHLEDFKTAWYKADEDGDFTTSTPRELFKFVTACEKMSYVHFFLEEHNH